jgi:rubrerythrin
MKGLTPDFKTVTDFRKDNVDCIKNVFKEFVFLCRNLDLFGSELVGIDGSKFKAVNLKEEKFQRANHQGETEMKHTEEKIESYLSLIEENDRKEAAASLQHLADQEKGRLRLKEKIAKLEDRSTLKFRKT